MTSGAGPASDVAGRSVTVGPDVGRGVAERVGSPVAAGCVATKDGVSTGGGVGVDRLPGVAAAESGMTRAVARAGGLGSVSTGRTAPHALKPRAITAVSAQTILIAKPPRTTTGPDRPAKCPPRGDPPLLCRVAGPRGQCETQCGHAVRCLGPTGSGELIGYVTQAPGRICTPSIAFLALF